MMMVEDGWRLAWEELEGGLRGFVSAVQKAWDCQRRDRTKLRLGAQWRCALALSSVKSLGQNVPGPLALACAQKGVLTYRQAAHFVGIKEPSEESVGLLAGLAADARCKNQPLGSELILLALAAVKAISDESARSQALAALAPQLAPAWLGEALDAAMAIRDERYRWRALAALAPQLAPEQRPGVLGEALAAAKAISDESARSQVLAALAPQLAPALLGEALAAARAIGDEPPARRHWSGWRRSLRRQGLARRWPPSWPSGTSAITRRYWPRWRRSLRRHGLARRWPS